MRNMQNIMNNHNVKEMKKWDKFVEVHKRLNFVSAYKISLLK